MLIFFLNLGLYYNAVEDNRQYLNRQHISIRKNSCFIVYTTTSPTEPPSVTSGLRMAFQPTNPALPIRLFCKELPNVYVFSEDRIFTTFCAPFSNRISCFKIVATP